MRTRLVVFLVFISACAGTSIETTTTTPVDLDPTTTTTKPQIVDGGLIQTDPATLIPFENAEPLVVGSSHEGVVSADRQWAAVKTELAQGAAGAMVSIVDLTTKEVVASNEVDSAGLAIVDDGQVFYFRGTTLTTFGPTSDPATPGTRESPPFLHDSLTTVGQGRVGYLSAPGDELSNVTLVVADQTGTLLEVELSVTAGQEGDEAGMPRRSLIVPAVAWTTTTAYVVDATENHIEAVDLISGEISEHGYVGGDETFANPVTRSVWASNNGKLFIATSSLDVEEEEDGWTATESAEDLVVVDTSDWTDSVMDIAVSELTPSPDGEVLAALGRLTELSSEAEATSTQSPVYLVDASTGEPLVGFQSNSGTVLDVQFSADGGQLYVVSRDDSTNIDVVDVAIQELVGNVAFTRISLVGEAGLMAFHSTPD